MRRRVLIVLAIIVSGCASGPVPKNILPPAKMQKIVYDLIRVDEFLNNFAVKDSTINTRQERAVLYEQTFKVHQVTRKEFYSSYRYYQQHPNVQKTLFDSLNQFLSGEKVDTLNKKGPVLIH